MLAQLDEDDEEGARRAAPPPLQPAGAAPAGEGARGAVPEIPAGLLAALRRREGGGSDDEGGPRGGYGLRRTDSMSPEPPPRELAEAAAQTDPPPAASVACQTAPAAPSSAPSLARSPSLGRSPPLVRSPSFPHSPTGSPPARSASFSSTAVQTDPITSFRRARPGVRPDAANLERRRVRMTDTDFEGLFLMISSNSSHVAGPSGRGGSPGAASSAELLLSFLRRAFGVKDERHAEGPAATSRVIIDGDAAVCLSGEQAVVLLDLLPELEGKLEVLRMLSQRVVDAGPLVAYLAALLASLGPLPPARTPSPAPPPAPPERSPPHPPREPPPPGPPRPPYGEAWGPGTALHALATGAGGRRRGSGDGGFGMPVPLLAADDPPEGEPPRRSSPTPSPPAFGGFSTSRGPPQPPRSGADVPRLALASAPPRPSSATATTRGLPPGAPPVALRGHPPSHVSPRPSDRSSSSRSDSGRAASPDPPPGAGPGTRVGAPMAWLRKNSRPGLEDD